MSTGSVLSKPGVSRLQSGPQLLSSTTALRATSTTQLLKEARHVTTPGDGEMEPVTQQWLVQYSIFVGYPYTLPCNSIVLSVQ